MEQQKRDLYDSCIQGFIIIGIASYLLREAFKIADVFGARAGIFGVGPDKWPKIILAALIISGLLLIMDSLRKMYRLSKNRQRQEGPRGFEEEVGKEYAEAGVPYIIILFTIVYAYLLIVYLGYFIGTLLFLIVLMTVLRGVNKIKLIVTVSLLWTISVTVLFTLLFYVPLPKGIGIFYDISMFFVTVIR